MKGALGRGKEVILRREYQRNFQRHLGKIRQIRTNSSGWDRAYAQPTLNQQKKHMMLEDKITQIQRQNRHLLQKMTQTINKRRGKDSQVEKMNNSLNYSFRKKQIESIDHENSKLIKRLQQRKSNYEAWKLKQEWKRQKVVIKNIANFPFILSDGSRRPRRKTVSKMETPYGLGIDRNQFQNEIQLVEIRKIDGFDIVITLILNQQQLVILGEHEKNSKLKPLLIPRKQALLYVEYQCGGKLQNVFNHLGYDRQSNIFFLNSGQSKSARWLEAANNATE